MVFSLPSVAHADSGFTIEFAGTVNYGGIDTTKNMIDLGSGRYAFTLADYQSFLLSGKYSFSAGFWYSGEFLFEVRTGLENSETSLVCTLSVGNYSSVLRGSCTTDSTGYGVCSIPFNFCPDASFDTNMITLAVSCSGIPSYGLGTVRPVSVSVQSSDDRQTSVIGGFFDKLADKIKGFFDGLLDGIKGLFIPSDGYFQSKQEEIQSAMEDRLGMVYQAGSLLGDVVKSCTSGAEKGTITFPQVKWEDEVLISEQEVRVIPEGFEFLQTICKTVTTIVICLAFLNMLRLKFEQFMGGPPDGS